MKLKGQEKVKLTMIIFGYLKKWRGGKPIFISGKLQTIDLLHSFFIKTIL